MAPTASAQKELLKVSFVSKALSRVWVIQLAAVSIDIRVIGTLIIGELI